jgi:hypothetical protein
MKKSLVCLREDCMDLCVVARWRRRLICGLAAATLLASGTSAVAAADLTYNAELGPIAHTLATRANVLGRGAVVAALSGTTLTLSGTYTGLASDATKAHLESGLAAGVPGQPFAELTITGGRDGELSGKVVLTSAQVAVLKAGGMSIVIDSAKAPDGNVWGWLISASAAPTHQPKKH